MKKIPFLSKGRFRFATIWAAFFEGLTGCNGQNDANGCFTVYSKIAKAILE